MYSKYLNEQSATNRLAPLKCKNTWQSWGKNCCYSCRWVCTCKATLMPTSKDYTKGSQAEWQLPRGQSHSEQVCELEKYLHTNFMGETEIEIKALII